MAALKYCTVFRSLGSRDSRPWFAIGPMFGYNGETCGVVFTVMSRNLALHRGIKAGTP